MSILIIEALYIVTVIGLLMWAGKHWARAVKEFLEDES